MGQPLQAIENLLLSGIYPSLKWKTVLSADLTRLHSYTEILAQDLSAEGKQKAQRSGYSSGDAIVLQIIAEKGGDSNWEILRKNQTPLTPWLPSSESAKTKEGCFIATAAYGSPLAQEIVVLKQFRDQVLRRSAAGRRFIQVYETVAPPIARLVSACSSIRLVLRILIAAACSMIKQFHWKGRE